MPPTRQKTFKVLLKIILKNLKPSFKTSSKNKPNNAKTKRRKRYKPKFNRQKPLIILQSLSSKKLKAPTANTVQSGKVCSKTVNSSTTPKIVLSLLINFRKNMKPSFKTNSKSKAGNINLKNRNLCKPKFNRQKMLLHRL